jgi:hypothetical protein
MRVGFTGTQNGCTMRQKEALRKLVQSLPIEELHHGDCIGADAQVHTMLPRDKVHIHPAIVDSSKRAFCKGAVSYPPAPPLDRNKHIVDSTEMLIACPKASEELRSGTWSTVRYARKCGRPIKVVWPDGRVTDGAHECD